MGRIHQILVQQLTENEFPFTSVKSTLFFSVTILVLSCVSVVKCLWTVASC